MKPVNTYSVVFAFICLIKQQSDEQIQSHKLLMWDISFINIPWQWWVRDHPALVASQQWPLSFYLNKMEWFTGSQSLIKIELVYSWPPSSPLKNLNGAGYRFAQRCSRRSAGYRMAQELLAPNFIPPKAEGIQLSLAMTPSYHPVGGFIIKTIQNKGILEFVRLWALISPRRFYHDLRENAIFIPQPLLSPDDYLTTVRFIRHAYHNEYIRKVKRIILCKICFLSNFWN